MKKNLVSFVSAALVAGVSFGGDYDPPQDVELVDLTTPTSGAISSQTKQYTSYTAANAFDGSASGSGTRWLANAPTESEPALVVYKFNVATTVNAYRIFNGGSGGANQTERAPKIWTFSGSNDGVDWTELDARTIADKWSSGMVRYFKFNNSTPYQYYRFSCSAVWSGGNNLLQIHELEFYHVTSLMIGECSALHEGDGFKVTASIANDTATVVKATATKNGELTPSISSVIGENITAGGYATGMLTGFDADTTYLFGATAENENESTSSVIGNVYSGVLAIEKIQDADEASTQPAIVRVSRAAADPYDLQINYTVSSEKAIAGTHYITPSGVVTIKAGETFADVELVPIFNTSLDEDATVSFTFATKDITFASADQTQDITIINCVYDITKRYVDATVIGGGQRAGTDWDDAYSSIVDAVNSVNLANIPATIYVKPGTYETTAQLELNGAIKIIGSTGNPADVTIHNKTKYSNEQNSVDNRVLKINDADAGAFNVTLSGAGCSRHGASVYIGANGGTVSNCVMGATENNYYTQVSAVYLGGPNALVTHCVIKDVKKTNNDVFWDNTSGKLNEYGLGIHIVKGLVENCLVKNVKGTSLTGANQSGNYQYSSTNSVGGVYLAGTGAVMRNCTIIDCQATKAGGINALKGAVVENCVVADCRYYKRYADEKAEAIEPWCGDASAFVNCATDGEVAINEACVVGNTNAFFKAYADGDLTPIVGGLLHDAGCAVAGWKKGDGYLDLAGHKRFVGKKLDIGAYEQQKAPGIVIIFE